jgi:Cu/Ag efflux protein CusF
MSRIMKSLLRAGRASLIALVALALPIMAQAGDTEAPKAEAQAEAQPEVKASGRAMVMEAEAKITAVDLKTRQVTLLGPGGNTFTLQSQDKAIALEDVKVGDSVVVTYIAAIESELRAPTAEEIAEPWVVLDEEAVSEDPSHPGIADMRVIRAVVTIEGMNRQAGTVTILDSRGMLHLIGDVEPEKMEGVTLGQTAVIVFAEAMALTLKHQAAPAEGASTDEAPAAN